MVAEPAELSGELMKWHKVTLTFDGPATSETAADNPFLNYRFNVTFTHSAGQSYRVPGYYAADGDAANTSAASGSKWRVHFAPDRTGKWTWRASFRHGENVAVSEDAAAGTPVKPVDGATGSFNIAPTDKTGRDLRGKGRLEYVGERYLRFAETGEYFLKCGADAPENFLAYADFDGDFKNDGEKDNYVKTWAPHVKDWRSGDPTWQGGKGKGMIGAINYLASEGMNVFSFLTLNIDGDDRNVFPYTTYDERARLDVSRLDQWEIVFEHADKIGMYLHFKMLETENELLLDDGDLGTQRKLYYRELIARFSHHLALNWNLGEEINDASTAQKKAWAEYLWTHDPYKHHIVIHNGDDHYDLLGPGSKLTGFSLQTNKSDFSRVHDRTKNYIDRSVAAGKPWVVPCDEPGTASDGVITDAEDPTHDDARKNALWGNLMAGGAGIEWYFGYKHPHSDLTCQDYRSRDLLWDQCRVALQFFKAYAIPFWAMEPSDESSDNASWMMAGSETGGKYTALAYLRSGGTSQLDLPAGTYAYGWFNPRTGDGMSALLESGTVEGGKQTFTAPDQQDWVLLIVEGRNVPVSALAGKEPIVLSGWTLNHNRFSCNRRAEPMFRAGYALRPFAKTFSDRIYRIDMIKPESCNGQLR